MSEDGTVIDHCEKCGFELNGEAAQVGDEVWCHSCADNVQKDKDDD